METFSAMLFYYTLYSFFGWLLENTYSKMTRRIFWKEGFYRGPFKPMYGFAPIFLLLFVNENSHFFIVAILCFLIPTIVEYATGYILRQLFHQKWWDYSHIPFQVNGLICLPFSLCWFFLAMFLIYYIHPYINNLYFVIDDVWKWLVPFVSLYFFVETFLAIKRSSIVLSPTVTNN